MLRSNVIPQPVRQNVRIITLAAFFFISAFPNLASHPHSSQSKVGRHSQSILPDWHVAVLFKGEPWLNILNMGSTALCEYSTALRGGQFSGKFPVFICTGLPLTPLHVKCSAIEISPRASISCICPQYPDILYRAPEQKYNLGKLLNGIKSHSHKSHWSPCEVIEADDLFKYAPIYNFT